MSPTLPLEFAIASNASTAYGRTLAVIAELEALGLPSPPVGMIPLFLGALEGVDQNIPPKDPRLVHCFEQCRDRLLRPLTRDHNTSALMDEISLLPEGITHRAIATVLGEWLRRIAPPGARPIPPGTTRWLNQQTREEVLEIGFNQADDDRIRSATLNNWRIFTEASNTRVFKFNESERFIARHHQELNTEAKRYAFSKSLQIANTFLANANPPPRRDRAPVAPKTSDADSTTHYPIGGYSGLSKRGNLQNLLPSELVYIERDQPIDWFTARWMNDELLYYTRESQAIQTRNRILHLGFQAPADEGRPLDPTFHCRSSLVVIGSIMALIARLQSSLDPTSLRIVVTPYGQSVGEVDAAQLLAIRYDRSTAVTIEPAQPELAALHPTPDLIWAPSPSEPIATLSYSLSSTSFFKPKALDASQVNGWFESQNAAIDWLLQNE